MKIVGVRNARWENAQKTKILCEVHFEKIGQFIPFSASLDDVEEHGSMLFNEIASGKHGPIQAFSEPVRQRILQAEIDLKIATLGKSLNNSIAAIRGITVENLPQYEAKIHRLSTMAMNILTDPLKYAGTNFNGSVLPSTADEIINVVAAFNEKVMLQSIEIEKVLVKYNETESKIFNSKSVAELDLI